MWVIDSKEFLPDSYTAYRNRIGLSANDHDLLSASGEVSLVWPYKDCVLEGGQDKEDQKRDEIFYNETLAPDEVASLMAPKAFTNAKRYNKDGVQPVDRLTDDDNLIIKGNNLLTLSTISKRFAGRIACIFIDPPYYFAATKPSDTFSYNSNFKLSTWLVFMRNRLRLARELLRPDGVLYMTISDEGAHYLKVLTDEVFGRENFIADITWSSRKSISSDGLISDNTNHVLTYGRDKTRISKHSFRLMLDVESFKFDDGDGKGSYRLEPFDAPGIRKNLSYSITNPNTGTEYLPPKGRHWRTEEETFKRLLAEGAVRFGATGTAKPQLKVYLEDVMRDGKGKAASTLWLDISPSVIWDELDTNTNATKHQQKLFADSVFTNPKPEDLVMRAIQLATNEGDLVLDFFLGSGTTAAAAHKMKRRYIGIDQMDYIETVALSRLQKVIDGEEGGISKTVGWDGGGEFIYCELAQAGNHYLDLLQTARTSDEIRAIFDSATSDGSLRPSVLPTQLQGVTTNFDALSLEEKRAVVSELIDKNRLYVNAADVDDESNGLTEADRAFTKSFYGVEKA